MLGFLLYLIVIGAVAGFVARAVVPGPDPLGVVGTIVLGVVGSFLAGFVAAALFDADPLDEFFDISTWLTAIVGALAVLFVYKQVVGRRSSLTR